MRALDLVPGWAGSRGAAEWNSQGREPLGTWPSHSIATEWRHRDIGLITCRPSGAAKYDIAPPIQGLTPLAIPCRRSAASKSTDRMVDLVDESHDLHFRLLVIRLCSAHPTRLPRHAHKIWKRPVPSPPDDYTVALLATMSPEMNEIGEIS